MASGFHRSILAPLARGFLLLSVQSNTHLHRRQEDNGPSMRPEKEKPGMFWTLPKWQAQAPLPFATIFKAEEEKEEEQSLANLIQVPTPQPQQLEAMAMERVRQAANGILRIPTILLDSTKMPPMLAAMVGLLLVYLVAHLFLRKPMRRNPKEPARKIITSTSRGEDTPCIPEQAVSPVIMTESQDCIASSTSLLVVAVVEEMHANKKVEEKQKQNAALLQQANQKIAELEAQLKQYQLDQLDAVTSFKSYDKEIPEPNRVLSPEKTHPILDASKTQDYEAFAEELAAAEWIQEKEHLSSTIEALRQQLDERQYPALSVQQTQGSNELEQVHAQLSQARASCQELATSLQDLQTKYYDQQQQLEELEALRRVDRNVMDMLQKDNTRHLAAIQQLKDNLRLEQEMHNDTVRKYAKDRTKQNIRFHLTP
jgi:hypothetical protein